MSEGVIIDQQAQAPLPPLRAGVTWEQLHREYVRRLAARQLMKAQPVVGVLRAAVLVPLCVGLWAYLLTSPSWPLRIVTFVVLGVVALHSGMVAHDLGHHSVTTRARWAGALGHVVHSIVTGQTFGHWSWQHEEHHRRTQAFDDPDTDVDIFALSAEAARGKRGLFRATTRAQGWLFWPVATLMAFSTRYSSLRWALRHRSWPDVAMAAVHLSVWVVVPAHWLGWKVALVNYVLIGWALGPWLMAAFYWNHIGLPTVPQGETWPYFAQRLVASRNLAPTPLLTVLFGGLNFHIEHHLAPRVPVTLLPKARRVLTELLAEHGVTLREWTWLEAMREVDAHIALVAKQA